MKKTYRAACLGIVSAFLFCCVSAADAQQITITNPANGAIFAPGSTINVTATVTGGSVFGVKFAAQDIGISPYQLTAPYSFSFVVPSGIIGPRNLVAAGLIANEMAVLSSAIRVDIEPSTPPTAINFRQSLAAFGYVGQQQRVGVTATFADGSIVDVSKSTQLTFASGNASLVSVDSTGLMTSLAPGNTTITASFGTLTTTLQTVGPTSVKGDLNGDGAVTLDDLLLLENMVGSTPTGPHDARDINGDGTIDSLDVQSLQAACGATCPTLIATTTSLTSSAAQVPFTQPLTLTSNVTGNGAHAPTGGVSFLVDGQVSDIGILGSTGQASVVSNSFGVGAHKISALYGGDANNAPSASQTVTVTVVSVVGDVNGDGAVNCIDLNLIKAAFGKRTGQAGFNASADLNHDGVVNVLDLALASRQVPAHTTCP